jgi:hypothetical protein
MTKKGKILEEKSMSDFGGNHRYDEQAYVKMMYGEIGG